MNLTLMHLEFSLQVVPLLSNLVRCDLPCQTHLLHYSPVDRTTRINLSHRKICDILIISVQIIPVTVILLSLAAESASPPGWFRSVSPPGEQRLVGSS